MHSSGVIGVEVEYQTVPQEEGMAYEVPGQSNKSKGRENTASGPKTAEIKTLA